MSPFSAISRKLYRRVGSSRVQQTGAPHRALTFEALEDRRPLAVDLTPLADINATFSTAQADNSSNPANFAIVGGVTYFAATTVTSGAELWRTDGTAAGTWIVKDIRSGPAGSSPTYLAAVGDTLYFQATDAEHGRELWKSDGTAAGTVLVKDLAPGPDNGGPTSLINANGTLVFRVYHPSFPASLAELWKSDGTAAGTVEIGSIPNYETPSQAGVGVVVAVGSTVYFKGETTADGIELWKHNLVTGNTSIVLDIETGAGDARPDNITAIGNTIYFSASKTGVGDELWRSDGTAAGTTLVKDIAPGVGSSLPTMLTAVGDTLYFWASDGTTGTELWKSNGTAAGTSLVIDQFTGSTGRPATAAISYGGSLLFTYGSLSATMPVTLLKSDGTAATTVTVKMITTSAANPTLTVMGGSLYVLAMFTGRVLWKSDGTAVGTTQLRSWIGANPSFSIDTMPELFAANGLVYFQANDGPTGSELWKSDGTIGGTASVKNIRNDTVSSLPTNFVVTAQGVYFSANDGPHGRELWRTDGTSAGTQLVMDIASGNAFTGFSSFVELNGMLVFTAVNAVRGTELWSTRFGGTTERLLTMNPSTSGSGILWLRRVDNLLYFVAEDAQAGAELWRTDGSVGGTYRVKDLNLGTVGSSPTNLVEMDGALYFLASTAAAPTGLWKLASPVAEPELIVSSGSFDIESLIPHNGLLYFRKTANASPSMGRELWVSDGTPTGTRQVKDITPGSASTTLAFVGGAGSAMYFTTGVLSFERRVWRTNGTEAGTVLVQTAGGTPTGTDPRNFTVVGNLMYFVTTKSGGGAHQLWKSDGTDAGTVMLLEYPNGFGNTGPLNLTAVGSTLYFTAGPIATGVELWKSDGTPAGTTMVAEIRPGDVGAGPSALTNIEGALYFFADDGVRGPELWTTDGTAAGTELVAEFNPGGAGSTVQSANRMVAYNGKLIVVAADDVRGQELWAGQFSAAPGDIDGNGRVDGHDFLTWQRTSGTAARLAEWRAAMSAANVVAGDIDGNQVIDGHDFLSWQRGDNSPESLAAWRAAMVGAASAASALERPALAAAAVASHDERTPMAVRDAAFDADFDAAISNFDAAAQLGPIAYRARPTDSLARQAFGRHRMGVELHAAAAGAVPRAGVVVESARQVSRPVVVESSLRDLRSLRDDVSGAIRRRANDRDVTRERGIGILEHGDDEFAGVR